MKRGLTGAAVVLAGIGAGVLLSSEPWQTFVGICLLLWANNVYEASRKE
jgi:hypothetical protein